MIGKLITEYLTLHNRIIIPSFGAFIKRPDGTIVFMSLLKTDDGVLSRLVAEERECSEAEGRRQIELYAAHLTDILELHKRVAIENLGYVVILESGETVFTTDKSVYGKGDVRQRQGVPASIDDADDDGAIQTEPIPVRNNRVQGDAEQRRRAIVELFDDDAVQPVPAQPRKTPQHQHQPDAPMRQPIGAAATSRTSYSNSPEMRNRQQQANRPQADRRPETGNRGNTPDRRPETGNRGNTPDRVADKPRQDRGQVNIRRPQKKKGKVDLVIILAMAAILIAIIAVIYGMGDRHKVQKLDEELYNISVTEGGVPIESVYME